MNNKQNLYFLNLNGGKTSSSLMKKYFNIMKGVSMQKNLNLKPWNTYPIAKQTDIQPINWENMNKPLLKMKTKNLQKIKYR